MRATRNTRIFNDFFNEVTDDYPSSYIFKDYRDNNVTYP